MLHNGIEYKIHVETSFSSRFKFRRKIAMYRKFYLSIIEEKKGYPQGYICQLPKGKPLSKRFVERFGENRKSVILPLLREALEETQDEELKAELNQRIKRLLFKPMTDLRYCRNCGKSFLPVNRLQIYCSKKCAVYYSNHRRYLKDKEELIQNAKC